VLDELGEPLVGPGQPARPENVFSLRSGAVIVLQTMLTRPGIHKAAMYEPPLSLTRAAATEVMTRFDHETVQGKVASALTTAMK